MYLDQLHWIRLARQHYEVEHDDEIADVLLLARDGVERGLVSFPLSGSHYVEVYRQGDPAKRQRLGAFMAELSRYHAIAPPTIMLRPEAFEAVYRLAALTSPVPSIPFGFGVAHALGQPPLRLDAEIDRRMVIAYGLESVEELREYLLLVGPDERLPFEGIQLPSLEPSANQLEHELGTAQRIREWGHTTDRAHRVVLAQETMGVPEIAREAAMSSGVDFADVMGSRERLTEFVLSLPAKGAITRMRMTAHANTRFRWAKGDLNDLAGLGTAAAYCDVVVAENLWGDVLQRNQKHLKARVITKLRDLPPLLVG